MMKRATGRLVALAVLAAFVCGTAGCGQVFKRKFVRKNQKVKTVQPILTLESDAQATYPPAIRYREHYAYWKSWHSELLASYGQIQKRDLSYLNGSLSELASLKELLTGEPQQRLVAILIEMNRIRDSWLKMPEPWKPPVSDRTTLQRIERAVTKKFVYSKIRKAIIEDPQKRDAQAIK